MAMNEQQASKELAQELDMRYGTDRTGAKAWLEDETRKGRFSSSQLAELWNRFSKLDEAHHGAPARHDDSTRYPASTRVDWERTDDD